MPAHAIDCRTAQCSPSETTRANTTSNLSSGTSMDEAPVARASRVARPRILLLCRVGFMLRSPSDCDPEGTRRREAAGSTARPVWSEAGACNGVARDGFRFLVCPRRDFPFDPRSDFTIRPAAQAAAPPILRQPRLIRGGFQLSRLVASWLETTLGSDGLAHSRTPYSFRLIATLKGTVCLSRAPDPRPGDSRPKSLNRLQTLKY